MLTGLIANALGWDHRDVAKLDALQEKLRYAARIDRRGEALVDYHTVDLGQPWMDPEKAGWTTRGQIATRGGASSEGTHIRYRHYRADSLHTVAVSLTGGEEPSVEQIAGALQAPSRPLFLGRKCCLPASAILLRVVEAPSPMAALAAEPRQGPRGIWGFSPPGGPTARTPPVRSESHGSSPSPTSATGPTRCTSAVA